MAEVITRKKENAKYSFENGLGLVAVKDQAKVKKELMEFLGMNARSSFHQRLKGMVEPKYEEKIGIEKIFRKYGVAAKNVWGK